MPARENEAEVECNHVFGEPAVESGEDGVADRRAMLQYIVIPEAKRGIAKRTHDLIAPAVVAAIGVLRAIDFDDELFLSATEVSEIGPYRILANKLMTRKPTPLQVLPQQTFGAVFDPTQFSCALGCAWAATTP